ncbi:MAG TPA: hypothetical protein VMU19_09060 [Bryobacteraceae bacterium]|nr:hypothetical protein [Bryobacteraceae bacterium]
MLCSCAANAGGLIGEPQHPRRSAVQKWWKVSIALFAAGQAADAFTSWGYPEGNQFVASSHGMFGIKAVGIKSALVAGTFAAEWLTLRRSQKALAFAAGTNLQLAGVGGLVAYHNCRIKAEYYSH